MQDGDVAPAIWLYSPIITLSIRLDITCQNFTAPSASLAIYVYDYEWNEWYAHSKSPSRWRENRWNAKPKITFTCLQTYRRHKEDSRVINWRTIKSSRPGFSAQQLKNKINGYLDSAQCQIYKSEFRICSKHRSPYISPIKRGTWEKYRKWFTNRTVNTFRRWWCGKKLYGN